MSAWKTVADSNYLASNELFARRHWRSAASRAYYAVFARCVDALIGLGHRMPDRGNPSHANLATMVLNNLSRLSPVRRRALFSMLLRLCRLRVMADYGADLEFDQAEARTALSLMYAMFREMRGFK
jgi:uncharacterized protein (UPF0332 family)